MPVPSYPPALPDPDQQGPPPDPAVGDVPGAVRDWARRRLGVRSDPDGWTALAGGRTNRVWRVAGPDGDVIVKLYAPGMASRLFPNSPASEVRALHLLAGTGLAPDPRASGETLAGRVLGYAAVDGGVPSGPEGAAALGRALAAVHRWPGVCRVRRISARPGAIARGILADLAALPPCPATARLKHLAARAPSRALQTHPPCLLHGDPVAANALVRPSGAVTLIDWQCPALGDPVRDLAIALSPGMAALYGHAPWGPAARSAFWDACGDPAAQARHAALAPLLSARIAAHFLAQAARGRPGYAAAAEAELAALEE